MTTKNSYEIAFTRKQQPDVMMRTSRFASSALEARNLVKMDEAKKGEAISIVACVKRS